MKSARSMLITVAVIAGLAEVGMAIQFATEPNSDDLPAMAGLFAAAFLVLAWFVSSGKDWPTFALIALFGIEIAFVPVYERSSWVDWAEQGGFLGISIIGVIAAAAVLAARKRVSA